MGELKLSKVNKRKFNNIPIGSASDSMFVNKMLGAILPDSLVKGAHASDAMELVMNSNEAQVIFGK